MFEDIGLKQRVLNLGSMDRIRETMNPLKLNANFSVNAQAIRVSKSSIILPPKIKRTTFLRGL